MATKKYGNNPNPSVMLNLVKHLLKLTFYLLLTANLMQAQTPRLVVPVGHTNGVSSVAFSPDGKTVLTGSWDKTAKLWDLSGRELQTFSGHAAAVISVAFSPDGKQILTGCDDSTVKLWDLSGIELMSFSGDDGPVGSVAFSPNSKQVLIGFEDATPKLWDLSSLELQDFIGHADAVRSVAFSPVCPADPGGGKQVLTSSDDNTAKLWDLSGRVLQTFSGHADAVNSAAFSPDGQQVLTGSDDKTAKLWDLSGRELHTFTGHATGILSVAFTQGGKRILTVSRDNLGTLWDLSGRELQTFTYPPSEGKVVFSPNGKLILAGGSLSDIYDNTAKLCDLSGREIQIFTGHATEMLSGAFSPDGKRILTGSGDQTAKLWDLLDRELQTISGPASERPVVFSPDGKQVLATSGDGMAKLWDLSGRELQTFTDEGIHSMAFSPDGKTVLTHSVYGISKLWDLSGKELKTFSDPDEWIDSIVVFSPDRKQVLAGYGVRAMLWDLSGQELQDFIGHGGDVHSVAFSPDGKTVLTGSSDGTSKLWDLSGQLLQDFGHAAAVRSVAFSPACPTDPGGGKYVLTSSDDLTVKVWDTQTGKLLATLIAIDSTDWVVNTPSGLFDASPGAMGLMHFVVNYKEELEVVELEQLKETYYEPGLLPKLLGFSDEPLREVEGLDTIRLKLYPAVEMQLDTAENKLHIQLRPRNGGVGKLSIFINGKEVKEEANPPRGFERLRDTSLIINLADYARYFLSDSLNEVSVRAYNAEGWLKSAAHSVEYRPVFAKPKGEGGQGAAPIRVEGAPNLFILSVGTSDYVGQKLDLKYAAKDAVDIAGALEQIGNQLLKNTPGKVFSTVLTTDSLAIKLPPTKANIQKAFEDIKKNAKAEDILVVYFSGHGIAMGNEFYYLTQAMGSFEVELEGKGKNISNTELTRWVTGIPALKQVLIIDACNSGKVVESLSSSSKGLNASQIRALERLKDRTGMFVLSGSAADKLSYESGKFDQGLLTYSLLQGMKILGSKNESRVDVMQWFQRSCDEVPLLAKDIQGVQTPMLVGPLHGSFDVGIVNKEVNITLKEELPVVIRCSFLNEDLFVDDLGLTEAMEIKLQEKSQGAKPQIIYVDVSDYPGAFSIRGLFSVRGETVKLRGQLFKGNTPVGKGFQLPDEKNPASKDPGKLANMILGKVWLEIMKK